MEELHKAVGGRGSALFRPSDRRGRWKLQPGVSFVFFTSHTPCESRMFPDAQAAALLIKNKLKRKMIF